MCQVSAHRLCTCAMVALVSLTGQSAAAASYTAIDLGPVADAGVSAAALNNAGTVGGTSYASTASGTSPGFLWRDGVPRHLGTLGGSHSMVTAINDAGLIVGIATLSGDTAGHAALWSDGSIIDLGTLGGDYSAANAVNDAGRVAGTSGLADDTSHAVIWEGGLKTDLGTLGGANSSASGINRHGWVVGSSNPAGSDANHATLWNGRGVVDLGTLGGTSSRAHAINDDGLIVGSSDLKGDMRTRATLWRGSVASSLGALCPEDSSVATSINKAGSVVGYDQAPLAPLSHAVLWVNGCIYDLNDITELGDTGLTLIQANAINERGQIVAFALNKNARLRSLLLTPAGPQQGSACKRPAL